MESPKKYKVLEKFEKSDGEIVKEGEIIELGIEEAEEFDSFVELVVEPEHEVGEKCICDNGKKGTYQSTPDGMVCVANEEKPAVTPSQPSTTPKKEAEEGFVGKHTMQDN